MVLKSQAIILHQAVQQLEMKKDVIFTKTFERPQKQKPFFSIINNKHCSNTARQLLVSNMLPQLYELKDAKREK